MKVSFNVVGISSSGIVGFYGMSTLYLYVAILYWYFAGFKTLSVASILLLQVLFSNEGKAFCVVIFLCSILFLLNFSEFQIYFL